jgi:hypothetical protein
MRVEEGVYFGTAYHVSDLRFYKLKYAYSLKDEELL